MQLRLPSLRPNPFALAVLSMALAGAAEAQDFRFRDGRFLETLGGVTIQRADDAGADEAVRNMPFLPGDRVWTDDGGRAEIVFADGEILWIAERSKVDSLGRGGREQDERLGLRVYAGTFGVRVQPGGPGFELQVAGGTITTTGASSFRVDARSGETLLSVSEGEVLANLGGERLSVRGGERVRYSNGRADGPYAYQRTTNDAFDRWCLERSQELGRMARENDRLPGELSAYGDELERNGEWVYDEPQGYVYVPRVAVDWSPYTYGRWVYTSYGWTWVDDQPWGFVTSHYGRWGYSSRIGWHWMPRLGFSGAWVSWSTPLGSSWSNAIGWCALGFNDRPVSSFAFDSRRNGSQSGRGWSFANRADLGRGSIQRRRLNLPADEAARAVVWNSNAAPDRDFREARRGGDNRDNRGVARSGGERGRDGGDTRARIYVKPTPGDSQSELRFDPATTIPNPESRRGPTIGQDGFKEEQDRKNGAHRDDAGYLIYQQSGAGASRPTTGNGDGNRDRSGTRDRQTEPATSQPQTGRAGARNDDAATQRPTEGERPGRDPLLNRFFRSITRPNAEGDGARVDDSARRREPRTERESEGSETRRRDDSSARESSPRERQPQSSSASGEERERSRPSSGDRAGDRERARPSGGSGSGERAQPRSSSPPPQRAAPSGRSGSSSSSGSSDNRGTSRRPPRN